MGADMKVYIKQIQNSKQKQAKKKKEVETTAFGAQDRGWKKKHQTILIMNKLKVTKGIQI